MAARSAGLCWSDTKLPIKQINLLSPVQPVHCPFLKWLPPNVALAPAENDPNQPSFIEIYSSDDEGDDGDEGGAQGPSEEDSAQEILPAAPFKLGPTPKLNPTVIPFGKTPSNYPRGSVLSFTRGNGQISDRGASVYHLAPVVSIFLFFILFL